MSAKRFKMGPELRAKLDWEEQRRELARPYRPNDDFAAEPTPRQKGRVFTARPSAGGASNDAPPAV